VLGQQDLELYQSLYLHFFAYLRHHRDPETMLQVSLEQQIIAYYYLRTLNAESASLGAFLLGYG
jgi:hypothetical protein